MFSAATARDFSPARRAHRRAGYPLVRRDPRRFARGMARLAGLPEPVKSPSNDARFFAHSFAGAFLFVSLLIA